MNWNPLLGQNLVGTAKQGKAEKRKYRYLNKTSRVFFTFLGTGSSLCYLKPHNWHAHPGFLHSFLLAHRSLPTQCSLVVTPVWLFSTEVMSSSFRPRSRGGSNRERLLVTPLAHQCTMNDEAQYPSLHICITCPNNSSRYTSHSHGNPCHTPKHL